MKYFKLIVILWLLPSITCMAQQTDRGPIDNLRLTLPDKVYKEWELATDESTEKQSTREWLPKGSTFESTDWIIVQHRIELPPAITAESWLKNALSLFRESCTDVKYAGLQEILVGDLKTYVGRAMCAQQKGKSYGVFADMRAIVDGTIGLMVISELRFPPTETAGNLNIPNDDTETAARIVAMTTESRLFAQEGIHVCFELDSSC